MFIWYVRRIFIFSLIGSLALPTPLWSQSYIISQPPSEDIFTSSPGSDFLSEVGLAEASFSATYASASGTTFNPTEVVTASNANRQVKGLVDAAPRSIRADLLADPLINTIPGCTVDGHRAPSAEPLFGETEPAATPVVPAPTITLSDPQPGTPLPTEQLDSIDTITEVVVQQEDRGERQEFVENVVRRKRAIREGARKDTLTVSRPYYDFSMQELSDALERASTQLSQSAAALETGQSDLLGDEPVRFANLMKSASELASAAQETITQEEIKKNALPQFPLGDVFKLNEWNPLARTEALAEIFSPKIEFEDPTSEDALIDRMVKFYGLEEGDRKEVAPQLKLADTVPITLPNGKKISLTVPNSGYVLGANKDTQVDCSAFVASALPFNELRTQYTTLDLRQMWYYREFGRFMTPPKYQKAREKKVKQVALSFDPINIYQGDAVLPGDILFYRFDGTTSGHVVIVKDFNPKTLRVRAVEASQSAGTVRERSFLLSYQKGKKSYLRPGIYGLRLKPRRSTACRYAKR